MPALWWTHCVRRANGYFGCEDTFDADGKFDGHNTWLRFLIKQVQGSNPHKKDYFWQKFNIFTRWEPGRTTVLVFDPPEAFSNDFKDNQPPCYLADLTTAFLADPYAFHARLLTYPIISLQESAVWRIRNLLRDIETRRPSGTRPSPDYPRLHDVARHAIHVAETLDLAVSTVHAIIAGHEGFAVRVPGGGMGAVRRAHLQQLRFAEHLLKGLKLREQSNKERLSNEINLSFNIVAQYDSRISVQIGHAARQDNSAMRTIAFMTLAFLPSTFISAIFSTSFFNYTPPSDGQPGKWHMSEKIWIFWVFALPLTAVTVLLWHYWHKLFPPPPIDEVGLLSFQNRGGTDSWGLE
ncbi:hypothetical protein EJ06DRAFT_553823 [Trichodelitschia bisporula]|uniref:Cora-domain-containing protein n=1 Tax=Trichodelitschia bisporula TaxID=703511 RepID=A0A6G1I5K3_9PEZI|nr:hypothetical protein EJ06DRAFT_553823 [Trichodelitschia bisporula]